LAVLAVLAVLAALAAVACAPPLHPNDPGRPGDSLRTVETAPGVRHEFRWNAAGPWAIHIVAIDLTRCGMGVRTVKALDRVAARETTTQLAAHLGASSGRPVLAAVNADFFTLKAPQGVTLGAQIVDGEPLHAGSRRPAFAVTRDGAPWFGTGRLTGTFRAANGATFALSRIDERPDGVGLTLYNRFVGEVTPADTGVVEIVTFVVRRGGGVGDTVTAVVQAVDTSSAGVVIGARTVVLAARGHAGEALRANVAQGDTVRWVMRFGDAPVPLAELVGGGTQLLRDGHSLAPFTGSADSLRHPRTAVGVARSGTTMLLVTVDGRQAGYSVGMTLPELTTLMQRAGATDALNLDGGGSTAMVVTGRVVNRPSDAVGERAVANALAVVGPVPGTCR
jgi:hypothetical protein